MKDLLLIGSVMICIAGSAIGQVPEIEPLAAEAFEDLAAKQDAPSEDDSYWQSMDMLRKHPLNLNTASAEDLQELGMLSALQITSFIAYRSLLGDLINFYELQSIPGWEPEIIRKVLPFIRVGQEEIGTAGFRQRWQRGDQSFLLRSGGLLEKSRGYLQPSDSGSAYYAGSPERIFFRYSYAYKKLLHFGLLGEKDPGEEFFRGTQPDGFDFYSFHLFLGKLGIIKALALGDFTVNLGQGLIQWQALAFTKGANVLGIKRQSPVLRPYSSAGEYEFHRGIGITLQKKNWAWTGFLSVRKLDGNLSPDSLSSEERISSFATGGYHRTAVEIAGKNNTRQIAEGIAFGYTKPGVHIGLNGICYQFSRPIQRQDAPYNLYAMQGISWWNASLDYGFTRRNLHLFGELAIDRNLNRAMISGALISLGRLVGLSLIYRNLGFAYQALHGNAFTENVNPGNENGCYAGLSVQAGRGWQFDFFFDVFQFPWLKYRVDGPGYGREYFVQAIYKPTRNWTLYSRFRDDGKMANESASPAGTHPIAVAPKRNWRTEISVIVNKEFEFRSRIEMLWLRKSGPGYDPGFLSMASCYYHPPDKWFSGNLCIQYFETGGYASRIYIYESDVLYSMALPAYFDKGYHYYINLKGRVNRLFPTLKRKKPELNVWLRWGQIIYRNKRSFGSGLDEISGNLKSEWKLQILVNW